MHVSAFSYADLAESETVYRGVEQTIRDNDVTAGAIRGLDPYTGRVLVIVVDATPELWEGFDFTPGEPVELEPASRAAIIRRHTRVAASVGGDGYHEGHYPDGMHLHGDGSLR